MTQEQLQIAKQLDELDTNLVIAYVEPTKIGVVERYIFQPTAKNIANFIGKYMFNAEKITITDLFDQFVLNTIGCFLDRCPNYELCIDIQEIIIPIQTGEVEPEEIVMLPYETMIEYWDIKEESENE